ncbi:MAG TPA: hypothetical protein VG826_26305 [Pirellulales bacterium]|nr:hypothetical protein [Pirellulales bacterium]
MTEIYPYDPQSLNELLAESAAVEAAVREAVRDALIMHKRLGNPVASWEDGRVVLIPPDQIPVDDAPAHH